jgi:hypothetical protein
MNDLKRAMADARTGKKDWIDRFALIRDHDGSN